MYQNLPDHLIIEIYKHLSIKQLYYASLTCKRWYLYSKNKLIWYNFVINDWPSQRFFTENLRKSNDQDDKAYLVNVCWKSVYEEILTWTFYVGDNFEYFLPCIKMNYSLINKYLYSFFLKYQKELLEKWHFPSSIELDRYQIFEVDSDNSYELLFDIDQLKWTFISKLDCLKHNIINKNESKMMLNFLQPYQVMPSCLLLYRCLSLWNTNLYKNEHNNPFFIKSKKDKLWSICLKHVKTGLIFELHDWRAALCSTFINGRPFNNVFADDALELLQLLTHPYFALPFDLSNDALVEENAYFNLNFYFQNPNDAVALSNNNLQYSDSISADDPISNQYSTVSIHDIVVSDRKSSICTGYVCECSKFMAPTDYYIDNQLSEQKFIVSEWKINSNNKNDLAQPIMLEYEPIIFDFHSQEWIIFNENRSLLFKCIEKQSIQRIPWNCSRQECICYPCPSVIPSSLILYRLICLFKLSLPQYIYDLSKEFQPLINPPTIFNNIDYKNGGNFDINNVSTWCIKLTHRVTKYSVFLFDYNGSFRCYYSLVSSDSQDSSNLQTYSGSSGFYDGLMKNDDLKLDFFSSLRNLLSILITDKFAHKNGTVAGSVL